MAADRRAVSPQLIAGEAHARFQPARLAVYTFADVAAFTVVLSAAIAVPLIFSTAQFDVFALPKTVTAVSLAVLLAVLLGVREVAGGFDRVRISALSVAVAAFVGWSVVAWSFAGDPAHALLGEQLQFQGLATNLAYVVFFVAGMVTVRGTRRTAALVAALGSSGVIVVGYGLVQRAGLDPIWSVLPQDRIFSTLGQANALSAYLVILIPLVVALAVERRRGIQWALLAFAALALITLLFTMSRGGYLATIVVALVFGGSLVAWRRQYVPRRTIGAVLVVLTTLIMASAVPPIRSVGERFRERAVLATDLSEGSTQMKLDLWAVSLAMAADHPLDGVGQDGYVLTFAQYRDEVLPADRAQKLAQFRVESPHNVYLGILNGGGVPLLAAYVAIIALVGAQLVQSLRFGSGRRAWFMMAGVAAAIAGHLVTDLFMTAETTSSMLFWTLLGVGAGSAAPRATSIPARPLGDVALRHT